MSELTRNERKQLEREKLRTLTPYSLPNNPSQYGLSAGQIKYKMYMGFEWLHDLIDSVRCLFEDKAIKTFEMENDNLIISCMVMHLLL